ncbi:MAG: hypothetical protein II193_05205 [Lachnospiraceae bacterium]|nr:hypothetical protein [Lachnospiraceae bacterium]
MKIGSITSMVNTFPVDECMEQRKNIFRNDTLDENCAVQLSISKIGREHINNASNITIEELEKQKEYISNLTMDDYMLSSFYEEYNKMVNSHIGITEQNMVDCFSKTYQKLYHEIMEGYQTGTRTRYVQDDSAESGYRKLTMDEELQLLDEAYGDIAQFAKNKSLLNERALINIVQGKQKIAAAIGNYSILPEILNEIERWERGKVSGNIIDILMNQSKYIKHTYFGMICKNTNEL